MQVVEEEDIVIGEPPSKRRRVIAENGDGNGIVPLGEEELRIERWEMRSQMAGRVALYSSHHLRSSNTVSSTHNATFHAITVSSG